MSSKNKDSKKVKGYKEFDPAKYINTKPVLKEAPKAGTAVIAFGRMNPVTVGHEVVVNKVINESVKRKAFAGVYLSHTSDKKKNPLSYEQKLAFAQKAFGKVVRKSSARTIIEVFKELQSNFKNIVVVAGSDRVKEFDTLLNKYNGKEYQFDSIEVISAGDRDPDSDDVSGMSASKLRQLAQENNMSEFKKGLPKKLQSSVDIVFDAVRSGMGLQESSLTTDEIIEAVLSRTQRIRRAMSLRRMKSRIKMGQRRASRRRATLKVIKKRARRSAISAIKRRLAKGISYKDMSYSQRQAIDRRVAKIPPKRIAVIAQRLLPKVKRRETERLTRKFSSKSSSKKVIGKKKSAVFVPKKLIPKPVTAVKTRAAKTLAPPTTVSSLKKEDLNLRFEQFIIEKKLGPQDPDIKSLPGTQPKPYYSGVAKDKKDDRFRHFARNAKKSDRDPEAYKPAPGDAEAETKPSKHTKKFAQQFGEACETDTQPRKRFHMLLDKNGCVIYDKRFKMYRKAREMEKAQMSPVQEDFDDIMSQLLALEEAIDQVELQLENELLESNPLASLRKKADQTGISYGILKKVFDRGVAAWKGGHRPGTTPAQWGLARVNSFATGGKTRTTADADLWAKHKGKKESKEIEEGPESWEAGYERRVVRTTKPEHKEKGYNWRIKGKERPEISIKLYKDKPSFKEFTKQMKRVAGHEFGG